MRLRQLALALAASLAACASPAARQAPAAIPADAPFRDEVLRFAELDRLTPAPACPVLFVGSSSIRMWETLGADLAPWPVLNRGLGGSTITDVNRYFDRVVAPYKPRAIVFYAGENDLDSGQDPAAVADQFRLFVERKRARLGAVPLFYISAKPSKARFQQFARQSNLNARIRALASGSRDLVFIDIVPAMLNAGRPRDLFVEDDLHMNAAGYAIWRDRVRSALADRGVGQQQGCRGG